MTEWREVRLGDVIKVRHGFAFKGEFFTDDGAHVLLTPGNFKAGGGLKLAPSDVRYYDGPVPAEFVLEAGDLVVVLTDLKQDAPILGASGFVPPHGSLLHNQRIGRFEWLGENAVDRRFIHYFTCTSVYRDAVRATATGATVKHTAPSRIEAIRLRLPSYEWQRRIADVLAAFDELTDSDRRRIEILEETTRSLYREWFVHYRFPGYEFASFLDSPLGPIPDGWTASRLRDHLDFVMGQSPPSVHYNDEGHGLAFDQGVGSYGRRYPVHKRWTTAWTREAAEGDVLVSVRAPVGRLNLADRPIALGRGLAAARARDGLQSYWFAALRRVFQDEDAYGGGTIFKAVTRGDLDRIEHVVPPPELRRRFEAMTEPLMALDRVLDGQIRTLIDARDLLLPRLVTGRIDVDSLGVDDVFGWADIASSP